MGQYRYHDPGEGGSAAPFYVTRFEPKDWWKWFEKDYKENHGWTQVFAIGYTMITTSIKPRVWISMRVLN